MKMQYHKYIQEMRDLGIEKKERRRLMENLSPLKIERKLAFGNLENGVRDLTVSLFTGLTSVSLAVGIIGMFFDEKVQKEIWNSGQSLGYLFGAGVMAGTSTMLGYASRELFKDGTKCLGRCVDHFKRAYHS